jgi:hypothetical protein
MGSSLRDIRRGNVTFTSTFAQYPLLGDAASELKEIHTYKVAAYQASSILRNALKTICAVYLHNNFAVDLQNIELSSSCHIDVMFGNKRCNVEQYTCGGFVISLKTTVVYQH